jgi:hypothetical protein
VQEKRLHSQSEAARGASVKSGRTVTVQTWLSRDDLLVELQERAHSRVFRAALMWLKIVLFGNQCHGSEARRDVNNIQKFSSCCAENTKTSTFVRKIVAVSKHVRARCSIS